VDCGDHLVSRCSEVVKRNEVVKRSEVVKEWSRAKSSGPGLQLMTPRTSSSGLVPNPVPQQPFNPPTRKDWDRLF
ncbi:hypothetical protein Tco_1365254, partial [Tanacetum coccineum]